MPKYLVRKSELVWETWEIEVDAASEAEAIQLVENGEYDIDASEFAGSGDSGGFDAKYEVELA